MSTSTLPPRRLDDGSIQVGRETLEAILDRLPPPSEMRCRTILREARFNTIQLNRSNTHPYALTEHDWPYVMEALGLQDEEKSPAAPAQDFDTGTPVIINEVPPGRLPGGYRATWFNSHVGMAVTGEPGDTHQEALKNLATALDGEAERMEVLDAIDSTT